MRVRDYMTTDVTTVTPDTAIMRLVSLIVERGIQGAVVTDEDGKLAGIITERDCIVVATHAGYFDELGGTVAEYMTADVETVAESDGLMQVAKRMSDSRHRVFPVVEGGKLVGLLSRRDVLRALAGSSAWFKGKEVRD
jgi:CBS domain-containing protein